MKDGKGLALILSGKPMDEGDDNAPDSEKGEDSEVSEEEETAAQELIDAVKSGNAKDVARALRLCDYASKE